jgi:hypothetical protein
MTLRTVRVPLCSAWISIAPVLMTVAWGGGDSSDSSGSSGSGTGTTGGGTGAAESSSTGSADESSTGGIPELCPDVAVETGIVGRTDRRTCEFLADCVMPETGVEVRIFSENPQVGGSPTMPGTLEPSAVALNDINSGVGGRFEFKVSAGTYHVCAITDDGGVLCSEAIVLSDDDPVVFAEYEGGTAFSWTVASCGL